VGTGGKSWVTVFFAGEEEYERFDLGILIQHHTVGQNPQPAEIRQIAHQAHEVLLLRSPMINRGFTIPPVPTLQEVGTVVKEVELSGVANPMIQWAKSELGVPEGL